MRWVSWKFNETSSNCTHCTSMIVWGRQTNLPIQSQRQSKRSVHRINFKRIRYGEYTPLKDLGFLACVPSCCSGRSPVAPERITARMSACSRMSWSIDPDSNPLEHAPNMEIFTYIKVVESLLVPFLRHETKYTITTTTSNERRLPGLKTYPVPSGEPPSHHLVWLPYPESQGPGALSCWKWTSISDQDILS